MSEITRSLEENLVRLNNLKLRLSKILQDLNEIIEEENNSNEEEKRLLQPVVSEKCIPNTSSR